MKTTVERNSDLYNRLDGISMTELERVMAKAHLQRGEYMAELLMRAGAASAAFLRRVARSLAVPGRSRQVS